jgi:hypothetical protein
MVRAVGIEPTLLSEPDFECDGFGQTSQAVGMGYTLTRRQGRGLFGVRLKLVDDILTQGGADSKA